MTTDAIYEERGFDWSHQVSAMGTTWWLHCDQTHPLSVRGVACKTSHFWLLITVMFYGRRFTSHITHMHRHIWSRRRKKRRRKVETRLNWISLLLTQKKWVRAWALTSATPSRPKQQCQTSRGQRPLYDVVSVIFLASISVLQRNTSTKEGLCPQHQRRVC